MRVIEWKRNRGKRGKGCGAPSIAPVALRVVWEAFAGFQGENSRGKTGPNPRSVTVRLGKPLPPRFGARRGRGIKEIKNEATLWSPRFEELSKIIEGS